MLCQKESKQTPEALRCLDPLSALFEHVTAACEERDPLSFIDNTAHQRSPGRRVGVAGCALERGQGPNPGVLIWFAMQTMLCLWLFDSTSSIL